MDTDRLAQHLQQPEIQRIILAGYAEPYSLGVTIDPKLTNRAAISLRIAGGDTSIIPPTVTLDGQEVTVVVRPYYRAPFPQ